MKLLLDECTPKRLRLDFPGHEVQTVEQAGLKGLKNGAIIRQASIRFEVLITVDRNLPFQQNLLAHPLAIVVLSARSNRYSELKTLVPKALHALRTIHAGDVVTIE
jgi:predicted nuclease of predicted toxin-antitoxin system